MRLESPFKQCTTTSQRWNEDDQSSGMGGVHRRSTISTKGRALAMARRELLGVRGDAYPGAHECIQRGRRCIYGEVFDQELSKVKTTVLVKMNTNGPWRCT